MPHCLTKHDRACVRSSSFKGQIHMPYDVSIVCRKVQLHVRIHMSLLSDPALKKLYTYYGCRQHTHRDAWDRSIKKSSRLHPQLSPFLPHYQETKPFSASLNFLHARSLDADCALSSFGMVSWMPETTPWLPYACMAKSVMTMLARLASWSSDERHIGMIMVGAKS